MGVTSDLIPRIFEHKQSITKGFTKQYQIHKLVYYEIHANIKEAIMTILEKDEWVPDIRKKRGFRDDAFYTVLPSTSSKHPVWKIIKTM